MTTAISFDQAASDFDRLAPLLWRPLATATLDRSRPTPGERVLDACCGTGASALPTARLVGPEGRVDAVDLSSEMIAVLQRQATPLPQLSAHQCDVTRWGQRDYDLVQSVMGIFFLPDMTTSVRALAALCRPGGRVAFTIWRRGAVVAAGQALGSALARVQRRPAPEPAPRHAVEELNTADLYRSWLTQIGLLDVRVDTVAHSVPLTADNAWLVVLGSGYRGMLAGLDSSQVDKVRHAYLDELHRRHHTHLDATSLIGLGTWPGKT